MKKLLALLFFLASPAFGQSTATQVVGGTYSNSSPYFNQYSSANPLYVSVRTSSITGTLPVANGGTGQTTSYYGFVPPVPSPASFPTVVFTSSQLASSQQIYGITSGTTPNTTNFNFTGFGFSPRNTSAPQTHIVEAKTLSPEPLKFEVCFNYSGQNFDIRSYASGGFTDVYFDGIFFDHFAPVLNTAGTSGGTAQAGGTNTITLASGESSTTGFFNTYTVNIISGTGSGQINLITAYNGSTKVATVANNWAVQPTSSSVYVITESMRGNYVNGSPQDGSVDFINLQWPTAGTHQVRISTADFYGLDIGQNDSVWPCLPTNNTRFVEIGDSFLEPTGGPFTVAPMNEQLGTSLGWQPWYDDEGGSGWVADDNTLRLNFMDRIAPPTESWALSNVGASAGTFTLSITYGGSTQTTSNIAYNATNSTVQTALNALSNVPLNNAIVRGGTTTGSPNCGWGSGYGLAYSPCFIILHSMSGATLTENTSGLTGLTSSYLNQWKGTIAPMVPKDMAGNALPFVLYVQGSGNDPGGSYSAASVQANSTTAAQAIVTQFPTALVVFSGITAVGTGSTISSGDVAYNTGLKLSAGFLKPINNGVPFIDTYAAGVGGNQWIFGSGTVGAPTNATNDILKSVVQTGHPTGNGGQYLATRMSQQMKQIFGAQ